MCRDGLLVCCIFHSAVTVQRNWSLDPINTTAGVIFFFRSGVGLGGNQQRCPRPTPSPKTLRRSHPQRGQKAGRSLFLRGRIESGSRSNRPVMKSLITGYSIVIAGRKTKVSLERTFWECLREIAKERNESVSSLVSKINADRQTPNLSSAIRMFVLDYYRNRASAGSNESAKSSR